MRVDLFLVALVPRFQVMGDQSLSVLSCPAWPNLKKPLKISTFWNWNSAKVILLHTQKITIFFSNPSFCFSCPYMSKKQGNWRCVGHKKASRVWLFYCRNNTRVYNSIYRIKITLTKTIQTNITSLTRAGTWTVTYAIRTCCQVNSKC